jgi:hypothetical protein
MLRQIQKTAVYILDLAVIYIDLRQSWMFIKKGVYYSGVKFFNNLPTYIKNTSGNLKRYKIIF